MSDLSDMKIVLVPTDEVKPYPNNPRKNDEAVLGVMNSIEKFGFNSPILLDADSVVICGHTRLRAAKRLAMDYVPCVYLTDLTDDEVKAYRLADNKVSEKAEWDVKKLEEELLSLASFEIDMSLFGFEEEEEEEKPEIEFADELLLEHNYIVLYFDNPLDWQLAQEKYGLEKVKSLGSKSVSKGIGRVVCGKDFL